MIKALITDFSWVLLFPSNASYAGGLNALQRDLAAQGEYNFWDHYQLNNELLDFYQRLGQKMPVYMFTSEYIQEHPAIEPKLKSVFKDIYSAARLEIKKSDPKTYQIMADKVGFKPEEILYIDDKKSNLESAAEAGMHTLWYQNNTQTVREIALVCKTV